MLPEFPEAAAPAPPLSDSLKSLGIALRSARIDDLPFLRDLYAGFRAAELALAPWSADQKRAFLDDQFRLQHIHFTRYFARSDFWLVLRTCAPAAAQPIGRLYLDRGEAIWRIVDIGFLPEARRQGLGAAMIDWIKQSAANAGARGVALQVATNNPRARALYLRHGFADDGDEVHMHQPMAWHVA